MFVEVNDWIFLLILFHFLSPFILLRSVSLRFLADVEKERLVLGTDAFFFTFLFCRERLLFRVKTGRPFCSAKFLFDT